MNTQFERNKLQRQLDKSGKDYPFFRAERNEFGEQRGDSKQVGTILGLYHEVNNYIQNTMAGGTTVVRNTNRTNQKQPRILCLYESITASGLKFDDYTLINGRTFKVKGVTNVQELNIIADISLEVIDDGIQVDL